MKDFGFNGMNDDEYRNKISKISGERMKQYHKEGKIKYDTFTGKKHSEETKQKMSKSKKDFGKGKSNSQYGTCWIRKQDQSEEQKIKLEELDSYLLIGWERGRILPKLVCEVGQRLILKDDVTYDEVNLTINKGETCVVNDIKGYGFDIITEKDGIELRFMNSQILQYFDLV